MSELPSSSGAGSKAMSSNSRVAVGILWFYCVAMALFFAVALWLTVPDLVSSGWSTSAARGFGFAAVFAGLSFAHGFLARGVMRRSRIARLGAVVLELAAVLGYLYLGMYSIVTDGWGGLGDLGGVLFGLVVATAVAVHLSSSEMRAWCDR